MGRVFNLLLLAAMIVGAIVTYDMKHKAEMAAYKVASLQSDIDDEHDRIQLLKAELSMLTQPARLQAVVEKYADYFRLEPFEPDQIAATIDEIPLRRAGTGSDAVDTLARVASRRVNEAR